MSDERFLERIADATTEQARSTAPLVEIQRGMVIRLDQLHSVTVESASRLRSMDEHLGRMDEGRELAVETLSTQIRARPRNGSRLIGWLLAAAATVIAAALSALALSGRR